LPNLAHARQRFAIFTLHVLRLQFFLNSTFSHMGYFRIRPNTYAGVSNKTAVRDLILAVPIF
jgi:hypothetical protein